MLRIIAGTHRSRKIEQPSLEVTRPTTDRIREAIFSSIQFDIKNSIILDLFSGSGAFAFESVSRGAMKVYAVEKSKEAISIIKQNKESLKMDNVEIISQDVLSFLKHKAGTKFDFIFLDPPYAEVELYNDSLSLIESGKLLSKNGLIILETNKPNDIIVPKGLMIQKTKKYGFITILHISKM